MDTLKAAVFSDLHLAYNGRLDYRKDKARVSNRFENPVFDPYKTIDIVLTPKPALGGSPSLAP